MKQYVQFSGATQPLHEVETNGDYYKVAEVDALIDTAEKVIKEARSLLARYDAGEMPWANITYLRDALQAYDAK